MPGCKAATVTIKIKKLDGTRRQGVQAGDPAQQREPHQDVRLQAARGDLPLLRLRHGSEQEQGVEGHLQDADRQVGSGCGEPATGGPVDGAVPEWGGGGHRPPPPPHIARKFASRSSPCGLSMLSGWNCTPQAGSSRCAIAMTRAARVDGAVADAGAARHTDCPDSRPWPDGAMRPSSGCDQASTVSSSGSSSRTSEL